MKRICIFLSVINILHLCLANIATTCNCDNKNETAGIFLFDDNLRDIGYQFQLLNISNDNLRLQLDVLNIKVEYQSKTINELKNTLDNKASDVKDWSAPDIDVRFDNGGSNRSISTAYAKQYASSCAEAAAIKRKSGLYTIQVEMFGPKPFLASCDEDHQNGGWTVIQRRLDGTIDFQRNWADFKTGFGNLDGEFFIGLDKLHALTTQSAQELLIVMEDFDGAKKYAKYDSFAVGDESEAYALKVLGNYSGDAGDSLKKHESQKFTTKDVDNDNANDNCAVSFTGAWWHDKCHVSNLNGQYLRGAYPQEKFARGIVWHTFRGYNYALKFVQMMIRPQRI